MHQADRHAALGHQPGHGAVPAHRRDVVDHVGAGIQRRRGDRRLAGVDRDRGGDAGGADRRDDRRGAGDFLVLRHLLGAGPGALRRRCRGCRHARPGRRRGPSAASSPAWSPPSEKLSGVTLRIAMIRGRSRLSPQMSARRAAEPGARLGAEVGEVQPARDPAVSRRCASAHQTWRLPASGRPLPSAWRRCAARPPAGPAPRRPRRRSGGCRWRRAARPASGPAPCRRRAGASAAASTSRTAPRRRCRAGQRIRRSRCGWRPPAARASARPAARRCGPARSGRSAAPPSSAAGAGGPPTVISTGRARPRSRSIQLGEARSRHRAMREMRSTGSRAVAPRPAPRSRPGGGRSPPPAARARGRASRSAGTPAAPAVRPGAAPRCPRPGFPADRPGAPPARRGSPRRSRHRRGCGRHRRRAAAGATSTTASKASRCSVPRSAWKAPISASTTKSLSEIRSAAPIAAARASSGPKASSVSPVAVLTHASRLSAAGAPDAIVLRARRRPAAARRGTDDRTVACADRHRSEDLAASPGPGVVFAPGEACAALRSAPIEPMRCRSAPSARSVSPRTGRTVPLW